MTVERMETCAQRCGPSAPPVLVLNPRNKYTYKRLSSCSSTVAVESTRDLWDRIFIQGYSADVMVRTNDGAIPAHGAILGMASPVIDGMLRSSKGRQHHRKIISIRCVPHDAVRVFLRFLYSSCYEQEEMDHYILHLLVLSHVFMVPSLKKLCVQALEKGLLNVDNVIDVLQLSRLCDTSRLSVLCQRMILNDFGLVSATEGWKVMRQSNPLMERELVDLVERKKERQKKQEEQKIYLQLNQAMEALVHICQDGCRTIGPRDKVPRISTDPCNYPACKGLEALVRHFADCKRRVAGGCPHCKRMWQLLELHSRICEETEIKNCRVPLCWIFKEKLKEGNKKDDPKFKLLVSKVLEAKSRSRPSSLLAMTSAST
ncbi:BTB/POZ and TAZ domain-containing protein [Rhynchospora pubera]|uniref:BTB/POZ and TAZ domain-containing protein n=1 Tax=Rhynchospora pubera TaxID=906938 RepID=A0AAV8FIN2_9POAL|nr:BTB/POZ and TAZ domain-containing protein [Rhynchospora pubera]